MSFAEIKEDIYDVFNQNVFLCLKKPWSESGSGFSKSLDQDSDSTKSLDLNPDSVNQYPKQCLNP
jgi:hypothetical protein